jgi:predicted nuclease of predicted toxin-antitoxin system
MRLLIDECIDERLRLLFPGYDCQTARYAKLAGLKNGHLLEAAEAAGFDVLITVDQHIPDQQNLTGRKIALVILCAPTSRRRDLTAIRPDALKALSSINPGAVIRVR